MTEDMFPEIERLEPQKRPKLKDRRRFEEIFAWMPLPHTVVLHKKERFSSVWTHKDGSLRLHKSLDAAMRNMLQRLGIQLEEEP